MYVCIFKCRYRTTFSFVCDYDLESFYYVYPTKQFSLSKSYQLFIKIKTRFTHDTWSVRKIYVCIYVFMYECMRCVLYLCLCVCACVCVFVCVCTCAYVASRDTWCTMAYTVYTHTHTHAHVLTHTYTSSRIHE